MRREIPSVAAMAGLLVGSQIAAIALSPIFAGAGFQAFQRPEDVTNTVIYLIMILAFTAVILGLVRYKRQNLAKYVIMASIFITLAFILLLPLFYGLDYATGGTADGVLLGNVATVLAFAIADELTSQRLPILLVIPKKAGYSFRQQKSLKEQVDSGEEREAMFVGLGDLIIPGILAISAFTFSSAVGRSFLGVLPNGIIAFGTVLGSLAGFMVLMRYVLKGNPQAGLPLLNGGALLGFIIASLLVYGTVHIV